MGTIISWTNETWNPSTGCSKVSAGCDNCYAEKLSLRYGWTKKPWINLNVADNVVCHETRLRKPYTFKKASRVFVNSMSDLFHDAVPAAFVSRVFDVMSDTPQHTYQILTKRPHRAARWHGPWEENIWMGTSVEDSRVKYRIDQLRECNTKTRFLSVEPLLGSLGKINLDGIHWVIVGGESGPGYRPMDMAWVRDIRDQCVDQGVAFFFKQDASHRTEMRCYVVEEDGSKWVWNQFPGEMTPPTLIE